MRLMGIGQRARSRGVIVAIAILSIVACGGSPAAPSPTMLAGRWTSGLTSQPCAGDWSVITLQLIQSGSTLGGQLLTSDGMAFQVTGTVIREKATATISVEVPPGVGDCGTITFSVDRFDLDTLGNVAAFSGRATGRCCGTIDEAFTFVRA
jgi:hypothetical protein